MYSRGEGKELKKRKNALKRHYRLPELSQEAKAKNDLRDKMLRVCGNHPPSGEENHD